MGTFSAEVTITRGVEDVFAVISNPANDEKWSSAVVKGEQTSPGPIGVGTTARFVGKILGREDIGDWRITEFEPNQRFVAVKTSAGFPVEVTESVSPTSGGTRVNFTYEMELPGFAKIATPVLTLIGRRQLLSALKNLKALMETNAL